jgi:PQQ-dependent catabolism-associated beta-propeller protein
MNALTGKLLTGSLSRREFAGFAMSALAPGALFPASRRPTLGFISNERDGTITVFDTVSDQPSGIFKVGGRPRGIHLSPDSRTIYVAVSDQFRRKENDVDAIVAVNPATGEITARHRVGSDPEQFALNAAGTRAYVANEDAGMASVLDLKTGRVIATAIVGLEPEGVRVSPDGRWVYVTAESSNSIAVLDTRTDEVVASFLVDPRPRDVAFLPNRPVAFITCEIGGTLAVVDTKSHQVIGRVVLPPGSKPVGIVCTPDGKRLYTATGRGNAVAVVDPVNSELLQTIQVGRRPWGIALTSDGTKLYAANSLSNDVSVIDTASNRVTGKFETGNGPWGIALPR